MLGVHACGGVQLDIDVDFTIVQNAARLLYGHIDNLELYVGRYIQLAINK